MVASTIIIQGRYFFRSNPRRTSHSIPSTSIETKCNVRPRDDRSVSVPILTLNQILNDHLRGRTLHFVSIDVEGMECEVLRGLDLKKYRPWIMIVEATIPGTPVPCFEKWESLIVSHGYRMVYFDGINRFYLSDEMQGLLPHFAHPPNVFHDYVPAIQVSAQHERIAELEVKVGQLTDELAFARRPTQ